MEPKNNNPPFVDERRIAIVDGLVDIIDSVSDNGSAKWISIEAPSGWGKTRLVQELYQRLAARQKKRYWPPSILSGSEAHPTDVLSRRKRVFPDPTVFTREKGALPDFMWLGVACESRGGVPSQVLFEDLQQLDAHSIYLEASWSALASFKDKRFPSLAQAKQAVSDVVEETISHGTGKVIEEIANVTVPGMGLLVKLTRLGIGKTQDSIKAKRDIASAGAIDPINNRPELIDETVSIITKLSQPGLPTILFVEDLHKATPIMEKLIDKLVRTNASVIIITSTWPGEIEQRAILKNTISESSLTSRVLRIQHEQPLPNSFFAETAFMSSLSDDSMRGIIKHYFPKVEAQTLALLAKRYNNPLPLELACSLPVYARLFPEGDLRLTEAEILNLPATVHALYVELWQALPENVQQALILATIAIPDDRNEWDNEILKRVLNSMPAYQSIALTLENEQLHHGWIRNVELWLKRFSEPDQMKIAQASINDYFLQQEIDNLIAGLVNELSHQKLDIQRHSKQDQHTAWLILSLYRRDLITDHNVVLIAVRVLQEVLKSFPLEYKTVVVLGELLNTLETTNVEELLNGRAVTANALGGLGNIDDCLTHSCALLGDQIRLLGPDAPDVLRTRNSIAYWLGESGQIEKALAHFETLLEDRLRILGPDAPDTFTTRHNIANLLAESGQIETALTQFKTLLEDQIRIMGPDAANSLTTRHNIAHWLGESGQIEKALAQYKTLLEDRTRVLGPDAPDTLISRSNIAYWLDQRGQKETALVQFETLLEDRLRILGPDAPDTLNTRHNIASWLAESGQIETALTQFKTLQEDQIRILGPDARNTLITRDNIAYWLGQSGQKETALAQFETLLEDQIRILGPDARNTLTTRHNIARLLAETGQKETALAQFETLLEDQIRVLGPDEQDTLRTRDDIANWLAQNGQIETALAQFETLLEDRLRILGPDAPNTLTTRLNIAGLLAHSGQIKNALAQFKTLQKDQIRVLGPDAPDTTETQKIIKYFQNKI